MFILKANLNVHLRKHTGDMFHCDHCSFTCLSSGHLKVFSVSTSLLSYEDCSVYGLLLDCVNVFEYYVM